MRQESVFSCIETTGTNQSANGCTEHSRLAEREPVAERLSTGTPESAFLDGLTEEEAYDLFFRYRWAECGGLPICPACGDNKAYIARRRRLICSRPGCRREFSATSGTVFNSRKLSFKRIIVAIREQATAEGRLVATRLGEKIGVDYNTAHGLRKRVEQAAVFGIAPDRLRGGASK